MNLAIAAQTGQAFAGMLIPGVIFLVFVAFIALVAAVAHRYKKIAPGTAGIFYGKKYKQIDPRDNQEKILGFKVVPGGGKIVWPIVENYQELNTSAFQIPIEEKRIPNKDNVPITVKGVATCKISTLPADLMSAAENFLGKKQQEISVIVQNIVIGHLRSIIATMDINELLRQRDDFNQKVITESQVELKRLGMEISLVIQEINDEEGYIDALGKQAVAEAIANAEIKTAQAKQKKDIEVSNADKAAKTVIAENDALVSEAQKKTSVLKATYKAEVAKQDAVAEQAGPIEQAAQEQTLRVAQADRDAAAAQAGIAVELKRAEQTEKALIVTVIKPAEAEKQKLAIVAEGEKSRTIINAEAAADAAVKTAEGSAQAMIKTATAAKTAAELAGQGEGAKTQATQEGEAAGKKALLLAQAEGEAQIKKLFLLAEAEGTLKLAEALAALDQTGKLMQILDKLPAIMKDGGDAFAKIAAEIFAPIAAGMANIDSINVVDFGGNGNGINKIAGIVPTTVAEAFAKMKAMGLNPEKLLKMLGIDPSALSNLLGFTKSDDASEK